MTVLWTRSAYKDLLNLGEHAKISSKGKIFSFGNFILDAIKELEHDSGAWPKSKIIDIENFHEIIILNFKISFILFREHAYILSIIQKY